MSQPVPVHKNFSDPFVFIQMNFWLGRLYYPIETFLKREQPDVFAAQEMLSGSIPLSPTFYTAESLIAAGHFESVSLGLGKQLLTLAECKFTEHVAVFMKKSVECIFKNRIMLYENPSDRSTRQKESEAYHNLLHTTLRLPDGAIVHVLTHHGHLEKGEPGRFSSPIADYNFKKIADYIAGIQGPIIFSGDFNLNKEATSLLPLKEIGLVNLNDTYGITVARNEFSWRANESVSHVFINDLVAVDEYRIPTDNVSDHLPIVVKCRIKHS